LLLGETRDLSRLPVLRAALATEENRHVAHVMREAAARLELRSEAPDVRIAAAGILREIRGVNALPDLQELADPSNPLGVDSGLAAAAAAAAGTIESWNSLTDVLQNPFSGLSL